MKLATLRAEVAALANPARAAVNLRFFRSGPGEYGEGDRFLGLSVPQLRKLARSARDLSHGDTIKLLHSPWHEERLLALVILVEAHEAAEPAEQAKLHRAYLANTKYVNNWDLVDSSAKELVGFHAAETGTKLLERLAASESLWERRIAMIATSYGIQQNDFAPALLIAERLLGDDHDLIHKAVGWMLREVGNRAPAVERKFLDRHAPKMARTALRYAIEKFPEPERKRYLAIKAAS
jgi:3-methyladenine DNA glycosylase AlkD